jgi:hypothetical protein
MGLSRLDNFLKNNRGVILYVNPSDRDATDSIENQGNSLAKPFKTIQRALLESARFSYQVGKDNDRFSKTTIFLYPGDHYIDNRPGYIPIGSGQYYNRSGDTLTESLEITLTSNLDVTSKNNILYKFNSVFGGVIIPRGTSIVGFDLRKTKLRPLYVPNPTNDNIERTGLLKVTGTAYIWQFTILDGDPNGTVFTDYASNQAVPNFSHHKLTVFEYADGVNDVEIKDNFLTYNAGRTDLEMYYEKVGLAYGPSSGRPISPDYPPSSQVDIQPKVDEYRIVGSTGEQVGISSIKAGDGAVTSTDITVTLNSSIEGLDVDTPIRIDGVGSSGYDGQYVVKEVISNTQIKYSVSVSPVNPLPTVSSATLNISVDTVTSASPYIFNVSLRSVYGMCGLLADGNKATGFKSMVVAQYTGIGLQKDDNAFVKYNSTTGLYEDSSIVGNEDIHTDSNAIYKPSYSNFHIRCTNNSVLQLVSIFAIGFAEHLSAESGGDQSVTNSNSNFGAKALSARGYRDTTFPQDDYGYISHIIPPKYIDEKNPISIKYLPIDVSKTVGVASTGHLYLFGETNFDSAPENILQGFSIGANHSDALEVQLSVSGITSEFFANIVMPSTQQSANKAIGSKISIVNKSPIGVNSITSNVITFKDPHQFVNGETVRIYSNTGQVPDGLKINKIYHAITTGSGISTNYQIKLATSLNDANDDNALSLNNKGGTLKVISRVVDKKPGDIGHPIQFDRNVNQWYINVSTASTQNTLYSRIQSAGVAGLGAATPRTFFNRIQDKRTSVDIVYRIRFVIPKESSNPRPPIDGYVVQSSSNTSGFTTSIVQKYFADTTATLTDQTEIRNFNFISNAYWASNVAYIDTELPHYLQPGAVVQTQKIQSTNNTTGAGNSGFNGLYTVVGVSSAKQFAVGITTNPGTFGNNTSVRDTNLPRFVQKDFRDTFTIYRSTQYKEYVANQQDGIYHVLLVNNSNSPNVAPFTEYKFSQPITNFYPQTDRDNPNIDPRGTVTFALPSPIGDVIVDDPVKSITRETLDKGLSAVGIGIGLTNIVSTSTTSHTLYFRTEHRLNPVTSVSIVNAGAGYGSGSGSVERYYNAKLVGIGTSTTGKFATAKITVSVAGTISSVEIMDGGSAYGIGNTLAVVGITTSSGHTVGVVSVTSIYNNFNSLVSVAGISSDAYDEYNNNYRIVGITTGDVNRVDVRSFEEIAYGPSNTAGLGIIETFFSSAYVNDQVVPVSTLSYTRTTGIATVTTTIAHGFRPGNGIEIVGSNQSVYNQKTPVIEVVGLTTFTVNLGIGTTEPALTGSSFVVTDILNFRANDGNITIANENIGGRLIPPYGGIRSTLSAAITSLTDENVSVTNSDNLNFNIGDYLLIDDEIVKIKRSIIAGDSLRVFRGVLGTRRQTHLNGSVIKKIRVIPIEFRRNSFIRASGHTFEYVGYGPGNYSTAIPQRQNKILSIKEKFLSQASKENGGIVVYTGMNDAGEFYIGNKKVSSATGKEEVIDAPIPTITSQDLSQDDVSVGFDVLTPLEANISRSIRVEGGPDNTVVSEFDGPVVFNEKIVSTSSKGVEVSSLFIQGDATVSRKHTVGIATPTTAGSIGDIVFNANPMNGDFIGWVYTTTNEWKVFGQIDT